MNLYKQFLDLLPKTPLQVGTVLDVTGGVATLELPDGSLDQARGDAGIGDRVFFRAGAIEGPAPTLTFEVIDL
jgi:hypothetical protein